MNSLETMVYEKVKNTEKIVGVLLIQSTECPSGNHIIQQQLKEVLEKHKPNQFELMTLCLDPNQKLFPKPQTEILYWFLPKSDNWSAYQKDSIIYEEFLNVYQFMLSRVNLIDENIHKHLIEHTEKMFEEEEKLPPTSKMLRGFAKEMWNSAKAAGKGLPVLVPAEVATERYTICEGCPKLTEEFRCTECGCFMKKKTQLAQSSCPLGKWDKFNKE